MRTRAETLYFILKLTLFLQTGMLCRKKVQDFCGNLDYSKLETSSPSEKSNLDITDPIMFGLVFIIYLQGTRNSTARSPSTRPTLS